MVVFRHNRTRIDPEALLHFEKVEFYNYDESGKTPLEWDVAVSLLGCKVNFHTAMDKIAR